MNVVRTGGKQRSLHGTGLEQVMSRKITITYNSNLNTVVDTQLTLGQAGFYIIIAVCWLNCKFQVCVVRIADSIKLPSSIGTYMIYQRKNICRIITVKIPVIRRIFSIEGFVRVYEEVSRRNRCLQTSS